MRYIILLLALASFSFAQPLSLGKPNEETKHSPWINFGGGIGIVSPASDRYKDQAAAFVSPSILLGIQFADLTAVNFQFDWTVPNGGWAGWFGLEQQFMERMITPFAEMQIGAKYPGRSKRSEATGEDYSFGDVFGVAWDLGGGVIFFRESMFRIRLKGGYECVFNKDTDMSWNVGISALFAFGRPGLKEIKVD